MATRRTTKSSSRRRESSSSASSSARSTARARSGTAARSKKSRGAARTGKNLLLRDIDPDVLRVIKARAQRSGRSLQQELHKALRAGARRNFDEARATVDAWHARLAGRDLPDSVEMIREDRDR